MAASFFQHFFAWEMCGIWEDCEILCGAGWCPLANQLATFLDTEKKQRQKARSRDPPSLHQSEHVNIAHICDIYIYII